MIGTFINLTSTRIGPEVLLRSYLLDGATIADYDMSRGVTGTIFASDVANQIPLANQPYGDAGSLLQASGSAMPWHLPFAGQKYLTNFGVAANGLSTPSIAATEFTGSRDIVVRAALNSLAPATFRVIYDKVPTATTSGFGFYQDTAGSGKILYSHYTTGSLRTAISTVTLASISIVAGTFYWWKVSHNTTTGTVDFSYAADQAGVPTSWTPIGAQVASTAGVITAAATAVGIGYRVSGGLYPGSAKISRVILYNGIGGTIVQDYNAEDSAATSTNGATFTSSTTGEVWTLNNNGNLKAQIVGRASLLFDGVAQFMKAAAFTCNQPTLVLAVLSQQTWTSIERIFDGNAVNSGALLQRTATPIINIYAGNVITDNNNLALNTRKVVITSFNGASSYIEVGGSAATTGNVGAANMSGFTLGAYADGAAPSNIQVERIIIRNSLVNAAAIKALLLSISGTT